MKKVYLAGPITGLEFDEATDWRAEEAAFVRNLRLEGYEALSPMRDKEQYRINGPLTAFFDEGASAVQQDICDIEESVAVIMNVLGAGQVSLGCMAEMGYAFACDRPVILVTEGESNPHHHVFTDYMATVIVSNLEDALKALVSFDRQLTADRVPYAPPLREGGVLWGGVIRDHTPS